MAENPSAVANSPQFVDKADAQSAMELFQSSDDSVASQLRPKS